jgi:hypothetical protein
MALVVAVGLNMVTLTDKVRDHVRFVIGVNIIVKRYGTVRTDDNGKAEFGIICH